MRRMGRTAWGKAGIAAVVMVVVLAVAAFAAWRILGKRPGEAAIAYIPADAGIVVTFDTAPGSVSQAALFERVAGTLEKEGLLTKIDQMMAKAGGSSQVAKEIRPYCTKSSALAVWIEDVQSPKAPPIVWLVALKDPASVDQILAKNGTVSADAGSKGYKMSDGETYTSVVRGYLVVSDRPDLISRVEKTASGDTPSIASLEEYKSARKSLPADANLMFFMSPAGIKATEKFQGGKELYAGIEWSAFSVSIREEGLSFDYQYPATSQAGSIFTQLAEVKPIESDLLKHLPAGAYGVTAIAQPSAYWPFVAKSADASPQVKSVFDEGMKAFQKETGLDVDRDILPALQGDGVLAVYPALEGKSADVVLEVTDANAADPAALADKVRALVEKKSGENGKQPVKFVSSKEGDATIWTLDELSLSALMHGGDNQSQANSGMAMPTPGGNGMPPQDPFRNGPTWHSVPGGAKPPDGPSGPSGPGSPMGSGGPSAVMPPVEPGAPGMQKAPGVWIAPQQPAEPPAMLKDKTINYAVVGKTVILTSSKASLEMAVSAYRGNGQTLADDPAYKAMEAKRIPHSQAFVMIDIGRIIEAVRPSLESALKQSPIHADDILGLFRDGKTGIMFSGRYDGKVFQGSGTLPLDYEKLIRLAAKGLDMANPQVQGAPAKM